ncbi:hypothetical protein DNTS_006318 [Danionella cerebrum]|uniref:Uncharacterized protein n=1 Tax=Danionella cerebrum TaxID=2873325 RepID=A0A553QT92_9TELE|nr:hypothetical protein DNTS_006318 [Danionella translucida]
MVVWLQLRASYEVRVSRQSLGTPHPFVSSSAGRRDVTSIPPFDSAQFVPLCPGFICCIAQDDDGKMDDVQR